LILVRRQMLIRIGSLQSFESHTGPDLVYQRNSPLQITFLQFCFRIGQIDVTQAEIAPLDLIGRTDTVRITVIFLVTQARAKLTCSFSDGSIGKGSLIISNISRQMHLRQSTSHAYGHSGFQ
jgi:hypothetical protein